MAGAKGLVRAVNQGRQNIGQGRISMEPPTPACPPALKAARGRRRRRRCGPPVGCTRGTSPWCPPALTGLTVTERGVSVPTRTAKHHGGGSPLRLPPLSPGPYNARALPPYTLLEPPRGMAPGDEAERRLHFRHSPPPPHGKGDAASRVWALSPPGTTDWAVFGRQVSGAWSVA